MSQKENRKKSCSILNFDNGAKYFGSFPSIELNSFQIGTMLKPVIEPFSVERIKKFLEEKLAEEPFFF